MSCASTHRSLILLVGTAVLSALVGCTAEVPSEEEEESTDDALRGVSASFETKPDGSFRVTCTTTAGIAWSHDLAAIYRHHPRVCDGIASHGTPTVYGVAGETLRFSVRNAGTYRFTVPAVRSWVGPLDHAEANVPAKLALSLDGSCFGASDVRSKTESAPDVAQIFVRLAPGEHSLSLAFVNDFWDQSKGFDRNLAVGAVRIAKISRAATPAAGADACVARGVYPAPVLPPPPPPPPALESPFDVGACAGAPMTRQQAAGKFAPATTFAALGPLRVEARTRRCNDLTGCAAWQPFDKLPYEFVYSHPQYGAVRENRFLALPTGGDPTRVSLRTGPSTQTDPFRLHLSYLKGSEGFDVDLKFDGSSQSFDSPSSWVGACNALECPNAMRVYGGSFRAGVKQSLVTASCLQIIGATTIRPRNSQSSDEYEIGFLARY